MPRGIYDRSKMNKNAAAKSTAVKPTKGTKSAGKHFSKHRNAQLASDTGNASWGASSELIHRFNTLLGYQALLVQSSGDKNVAKANFSRLEALAEQIQPSDKGPDQESKATGETLTAAPEAKKNGRQAQAPAPFAAPPAPTA